jgi:ABC-2 type transport system ATP-binding protein
MSVLEIKGLNKSYGRIKALQDLSLSVEEGQVLGILGPNGSGKTTTLGIILDVLKQDSGAYVWFGGSEGKYHRKKIGAVLETPNFYPFLNAIQNLKIVAETKNIKHPDIEWILGKVGLSHRKTSKFSTFYLGMKQRLAIGSTLIGDPKVLIFDEPTNGLDPAGIAEVRELILSLAYDGRTIIMASHILDEVEKICSHVAILKSGRLLASGSVGTILSDDQFVEISAENMEQLRYFIAQNPMFKNVIKKAKFFECQIPPHTKASEINSYFFEKGLSLSYLNVRSRKLEEEFITITSKSE